MELSSDEYLDRIQALADDATELLDRLEEATATIILASRLVGPGHPAWVVLDGYDGSGDNVRELEALGFAPSGNGGWYAPIGGDRGTE